MCVCQFYNTLFLHEKTRVERKKKKEIKTKTYIFISICANECIFRMMPTTFCVDNETKFTFIITTACFMFYVLCQRYCLYSILEGVNIFNITYDCTTVRYTEGKSSHVLSFLYQPFLRDS